MVALDGGPGEGVRLEAVAGAVYITHAFDGSVDIASSGIAWSVGASGIGVSATTSLGCEASANGGSSTVDISS